MKNQALTRYFLAPALLASVLAGTVTGCGGGSKSSSTQMVAATTMAMADGGSYMEETAAASYDIAYDASYEGSYSNDTMEIAGADRRNDMEQPAAVPGGGANALTSSVPIEPVQTRRKLIRTVDLHVETTDFDKLIDDITSNVTAAGGYIEQSNVSGSSISGTTGRRNAHYIARVPSDKLDGFITRVGEQGNITNKSEYTQDVTLQYSDIESRKKSLTIEQERLWALLEKADTLEAVIALEERLSEIRYQLESFESQLRTYDNQVDYSTITIYIDEVQVLTPTSPDSVATRIRKGFRRNLETVAVTAVNLTVWFLSSLPTLFVLALLILAAIFIARKGCRLSSLLLRRRSKSMPGAQTPPDSGVPVTSVHTKSENDTAETKQQ